MALYRLEEWQNTSGYWYCEHTSTHPPGIQKWILPARLLGMTADVFLQWLIDNYKPDYFFHSKSCDFVGWGWKDQTMMRKYKNFINKKAREINFTI